MGTLLYIFSFLVLSGGLAQEPVLLTKKEKKFVASAFPGQARVTELDLGNVEITDPEAYQPGDRLFVLGEPEQPAGYLLSTRAMGRYEYFDYLVAFGPDLLVMEVVVTTYRSSHGAAICQKKWLGQFAGYSGEELSLGKDIDSISGATISAGSMVRDLGRCHRLMESLRQEGRIGSQPA